MYLIDTDILSFMYPFTILPFDDRARKTYQGIGSKTIGSIRGSSDAKLASIAVSNNLIVVTHNTKDFMILQEKIGVVFEDWME